MTNSEADREMSAARFIVSVYRRGTTRHNATQRGVTQHSRIVPRDCASIRDYVSAVSIVYTRYSTRKPGIIFVKPLSAADHVRRAEYDRSRAQLPNRATPAASRIRFDSTTPARPVQVPIYSFLLASAALFGYSEE